MTDFRARLAAYGRGAQPGRAAPPHNAFVAGIQSISAIAPRDRIDHQFRQDGLTEATDFQVGTTSARSMSSFGTSGDRELRERKLNDIGAYSEFRGGEVLDR